MAEEDLTLQLKLVKDQARQQLAEFGHEAQAQIAGDLSQFQGAEQQKVAAAANARAQRTQNDAAAHKTEVAAAIVAEQAKVEAATAGNTQRVATAVVARAAEVAAARQAALQEAAAATEGQRATQLAIVATSTLHRQAAAAAITDARETSRARIDASQAGALAVRQATEMERFQVDELGASYVRVRVVQEASEKGLLQIGQSGPRAIGGVTSAAKAAAGELDKSADATRGFGSQMLALAAGHAALSALRGVGAAIAQAMQEASEWLEKVAKDFAATQQSMQGIAALTGKKNTDEFALGMVKEAAAANVKPEEYKQLQESFLSRASAYVGDDPNAKMTEGGATQFEQSLAEYAAAHGVSQAEMGSFAGGLVSQWEPSFDEEELTPEKLKAQAGRVFGTLEASSAPVSHLLSGMTRVQAQGLTADEAAPLLAMMPEIAPEEESTHLLRVFAEMRQVSLEKDKADKFGLKKGARPAEQLESLIGNLEERQAKGENLDEMLNEFSHEAIATNTIRGMINRGGTRAIRQWQGIRDRVPVDTIDADNAAARTTTSGRQRQVEAQAALADATRGARFAEVERLKMEAATQLKNEGQFDRPTVGDVGRNIVSHLPLVGTGISARDQKINELAYDKAFKQSGLPENQRLGLAPGASQAVANDMIWKLLERQVKIQEQQLQLQQQAAAKGGAAHPPGPVRDHPTPLVNAGGRGGVRF